MAASIATGSVRDWTPPLILDVIEAAGLAPATVSGSQKATDYGLNAASVAVIAIIGGCGGGVLRDVLTAQVPRVLRADFYATAALLGAVLMVVLVPRAGVARATAALCTGLFVFALRTAALTGHWALPHLR